jgi:hypothetical protein
MLLLSEVRLDRNGARRMPTKTTKDGELEELRVIKAMSRIQAVRIYD